MRKRWLGAAGLILAVAVIFLVQYSSPMIIGADGNLHARLSLMVAGSGFLKSLPQAHFSWFATRFSDKDFLYHLYLVPFVTVLGYTAGAKLAAAAAFSALALTVFLTLKRLVPWHFAAAGMALFVLSPQFLRDMSEPRPFVLAVALTVLGVDAVIRKNMKAVFLTSLLYGMAHLSAWTLPAFALILSVSEWAGSGKFPARTAAASFGGYALSFLLHPNFPNNIFFAYLNGVSVPWYAVKGGVLELGAEFFPVTTRDLLFRFPVYALGGLALLTASAHVREPARRETAGWAIAAAMFAGFGIVSLRNLSHLYPVAVIFLILFTHSFFASKKSTVSDRLKSLIIPLLAAAILYSAYQTVTVLRSYIVSDIIWNDHYLRVSKYMEKNIPPGSRIFHTNWSDSQFLIGMAPQYEYLVTLDPIYMYSYNKPLYEAYRRVSFGNEPDTYKYLTEAFGTYYGYAGKNYFSGFSDRIRKDPRFTVMAEDELGIVFSVKPTDSGRGRR